MKQLKRIPFTKEGLEKVKKELEDLKLSRPEAVAKLAEARALGDLSENGLYTAAKARLRSMDSRIFQLGMQIKLADIVRDNDTGLISLGSTVEVINNSAKYIFHIVGDLEANPNENKITQHSPIGNALIGKKVGDSVKVITPKGDSIYKVLQIS